MNKEEFEKVFENECKKNKIEYKVENVKSLYEFMKHVQFWNCKVSLTAVNDDIQFCVKHLIDSLSINKYAEGKNRLLDIGTGAGFPGIPLKIYNSKLDVTLIDSVNKKIVAVNDIIEKLDLHNIEALHVRAEELARDINYREKFDVVTTRAVSNLSTISEYMIPFLKIGGIAICMKGPNINEELENAQKAIEILGGKIEKIDNFKISNEYDRNIIIIKKIKNTKKEYPRGQGKPLKNPLK